MKYAYNGPGPQEDPDGGLVRPGDVREFSEAPDWGPWLPVDDGADSDSAAPAVPAPATPPVTPPAAVSQPQSTPPAAPAAKPEGM